MRAIELSPIYSELVLQDELEEAGRYLFPQCTGCAGTQDRAIRKHLSETIVVASRDLLPSGPAAVTY